MINKQTYHRKQRNDQLGQFNGSCHYIVIQDIVIQRV
jgi:hypothetical protein